MTIIKPKIGGKYKWKGQSERLVYIGYNYDGGWWHQFALAQSPDVVWCEVQPKELELLEVYH